MIVSNKPIKNTDYKRIEKKNKDKFSIFIIGKIKSNKETKDEYEMAPLNPLNKNKEKINDDFISNNGNQNYIYNGMNSKKKEDLNYLLTLNDYIDNSSNSINENIISFNELKEKLEEKESNLLGKKRRIIFRILYPNKFIIFTPGEFNNYTRKFINNFCYNDKKPKIIFLTKNVLTNQKRKDNADNIRKKIKARFLKSLKNTINQKLKLAGSEKFFNFLQQIFISNVSKEMNKEVLDLTFKEIFSKNFCRINNKTDSNNQKYYDNLSVLEYLEKNKNISQKSNYNIFKNMRYYQIFEEYLRSKEFEIEIDFLRQKENEEYIKKYIQLAYNLNAFFCE